MVAYSFLLHPDGTLFEGRSSRYLNGANRNDKGGVFNNSNTVSVCFIGDYRTLNVSSRQRYSLSRLLSDLRRDGVVAVDAELMPHSDLAFTACPSRAFDQLLESYLPVTDDDYDDDEEDLDMMTLLDTTTGDAWIAAGNVARALSDPAGWIADWDGPVRAHPNMRYVIGDLYTLT